jgi:hypothetical protein
MQDFEVFLYGCVLACKYIVLGRNTRQSGKRAAAKALGLSTEREVVGAKKRVLSAAGIAAIVKAAKKRWAKVRAQTPKAA